jgi:hypothetical protein
MQTPARVFGVICLLGALLTVQAGVGKRALAQESARHTTILVPYTEYEWWLINFADNSVLCQVLIDHEGLPTLDEVAADCGQELANAWFATNPCDATKIEECRGVYLFLAATTPKEREVVVELPTPIVWVSLEGCSPSPPSNFCPSLPTLVLTGEEPLPEQRILSIQGTYDGEPFYCEGEICKLPLHVSPLLGATITFFANSSYGDTSDHYTAQVRVIETGVSPQPGATGWYVDVISSQWLGAPLASCAGIWEAFPPLGTPPTWLSTPDSFQLMASENPYYYLAGRLIAQGLVDVSECPAGGLLPNGYADGCGLEKSRPVLADWQNQFDQRIIDVGKETGVPAQLMKNLFAQESQFWPGEFRVPFEFGLGQITDQGADAVMIWNTSYFAQFCPLVLSQEACDQGYLGLSSKDQAVLRGALALQARADCPDCPTGIDLSNVHFTVSLFANTLIANCAQVARSIYTATNQMAGRLATYEDLWRLTVANYHAGPGCTSYAINQAWDLTNSLSWQDIAPQFTEPCMGVVPYVDQITK